MIRRLALAATLAMPCAAFAQTDPSPAPRFWLTNEPNIAVNPRLIPSAWAHLPTTPTAVGAAANVHTIISNNGLTAGEVEIQLRRLGSSGALLWTHPSDALPTLPPGVPAGTPTPWMSYGIADMITWIDDFIIAYKANSDPAPTRLSLDSEVAGYAWGHDAYKLYQAYEADPRWSTEIVSYFNAPMSVVVATYPPPSGTYSTGISFDSGSSTPGAQELYNKAWFNWWAGIMQSIMDGATYDAVYSRFNLSTNFPNCICGDYNIGMRVDGGGSGIGRVVRSISDPGYRWHWYVSQGSGQFQPYPFYPVPTMWQLSGESNEDATVRVRGWQVDSCIDSFGGGHEDEMSYWIPAVGQYTTANPHTVATKTDVRQALAHGRSRHVRDYDIFNDYQPSATNWGHLGDAIEEVWSSYLWKSSLPASLYGSVIHLTSTQMDNLRYGVRDLQTVNAPTGSPGQVSIENTFYTSAMSLSCTSFEIFVEAKANTSSSVALTVRALNVSTGVWDSVGTSSGAMTSLSRLRFSGISASNYINSTTNECQVRLEYSVGGPVATPLAIDFDLIQMIGVK